MGGVVPARVRYRALIGVCAECKGDPKALRKALKREVKQRGRRDVRVIATSCLDVCPKHATTVAASAANGTRLVVVKSGARPAAVVDVLLGAQNSLG